MRDLKSARAADIRAFLGGLVLGALLLGGVGGGSALAHDASLYYTSPYGSGDLPDVTYRFTTGVPSTTFRNRVEDGGDKWSGVPGVALDFVRGNLVPDNFDHLNCNAGPTGIATIHYKHDVIGYAETKRCVKSNGNMRDFRIAFDRDLTWNITMSDPMSNEVDVWAVAAHEFGHGTGGWTNDSPNGHFTNNEMCPSGDLSSWQTMCAGTNEYGKKFRRTLEDHDKDTFSDAYD